MSVGDAIVNDVTIRQQETTAAHGPVEAPPWIASLPRDRRGFPAPAEAGWTADGPALASLDQGRKTALGMKRACAVCGRWLEPGRPVYRAFAQADAAQIRLHERELTHDEGGPGHLSCMLYATYACPYLAHPTARLGKDSAVNPGAARGTRPAVLGFTDFRLGLHSPPDPSGLLALHDFDPTFGYLELVDDLPYRQPEDLISRYQAAVEADAYCAAWPANYWTHATPDPDILSVLQSGLQQALATEPDTVIPLLGRQAAMFKTPLC